MSVNNSSIIVNAHGNIAGTLGNLKEYVFSKERTIGVAEFVMGTLVGAGFLGAKQMVLFNNAYIDKVSFIGHQDGEELKFRKYMEDKIAERQREVTE